MIKKATILIIIMLGVQGITNAQEKSWFADFSLQKGVGFNTLSVNYRYITVPTSEKIYYHPGGGTGVDLGFGYHFSERFSFGIYGTYQLIFIERTDNFGSIRNRSSAVFNRKTIKGDFRYTLLANNSDWLKGAIFYTGPDYHFPGKFKRKVNQTDRPTLHYDISLGFHGGAGMLFELAPEKGIDFKTAITFRFVDFEYKNPEPDDAELKKISGAGVDFQFGIVKNF